MCLAIPVLIKSIEDKEAEVEIGGITRRISLWLTPEAKVGDYVLVHTGYAINVLDQEQAEETLSILREIAEAEGVGVGIGEVLVLDSAEFEDRSVAVSPHYTGLPSVLKMGRELKLDMPEQVTVIGIGVADPFSFDEKLSPELEKALPAIVERIARLFK